MSNQPKERISFVTRVERVWAQPRGKLALVGGTVVVLVLLGVLLRRLPGTAVIGPGPALSTVEGATATSTSAIAQATTPTSAPTRAAPAPSAEPQEPGGQPLGEEPAPPPSAESQAVTGLYGGPVDSLVINPNTPTTLYATISNPNVGLFRSMNGGESWELVFASNCCAYIPVAMDPLSPNRIYMGRSGEGLYRSDDGGDAWTAIPIPNASAPNAPCVEVWESPQTMVVPGSVSPNSGPMMWTIPCRSLSRS